MRIMTGMEQDTHIESKANEDRDRVIPPYVPWPTLLTFIEPLKATVTPSRIDHSIMQNFSGAVRSQLLVALKFLGLIEPDGTATKRLKDLVSAYQTDEWKSVLGDIITVAYAPIIGGIDLQSATSTQLDNQFRENGGVSGSTIDKCTRFYLSALTAADISFSPHFSTRRSRANSKPDGNVKRPQRQRRSPKESTPPSSEEQTPSGAPPHESILQPPGTTRLQIPIPGKAMATIIFPDKLDEQEWEMIDQYFRNYVKLRSRAENGEKQEAE